MEFKNISAFMRVSELGSFTKAAEEMGYSQSTITIQIKQLEDELGFRLFDRLGKYISLTSKGEEFIKYANEFLRLQAEAQKLGESTGRIAGFLRLGVVESLFVWKIAEMLPEFHRQHPDVQIEIKSGTGAALFKMLRQNEVDIIYILDNVIYHKDCVRACVSPVTAQFIAHPEHRLCGLKGVHLAEILKEPLILAERDAIYRRELDTAAANIDLDVIPALEIDNLEVVLRLLKKGMGVSFIPDYVARESLETGELCAIDVSYDAMNIWSQTIYHKNKYVTPQMEALIEAIRKNP